MFFVLSTAAEKVLCKHGVSRGKIKIKTFSPSSLSPPLLPALSFMFHNSFYNTREYNNAISSAGALCACGDTDGKFLLMQILITEKAKIRSRGGSRAKVSCGENAGVEIAPFLSTSAILYSYQLSEPINAVCQVLLRTNAYLALNFIKIVLITL